MEAFAGCTGLTSVSIPNSTTNIEAKAFENCTKLSSITNKSLIPQSIESTVFSNHTINNAVLCVSLTVVEDYKNAAVWKGFKTITQIESDNATLKNITATTVDGIEHSLTYNPATRTYTDTVANSVENVIIAVEKNYSTTIVEGDLGSKTLKDGDNTFTISTVSEDKSIAREYKVKIRRLSKNTELKPVTIKADGKEYTPTFSPYTTYLDTVAYSVSNITIHVEQYDPASILEGDGYGYKELKVGDNIFTVVVKDEDRTDSATYTIKVRRLSNDATLKNFILTDTNGVVHSPVFNPDDLFYTDTVASDISGIWIEAKANYMESDVYGHIGFQDLDVGDNDFTVRIDSEDKTVTNEYKLKVRRLSNDATLKELTVSEGTLTPAFDSCTFVYTDTVQQVSSIVLTPVTNYEFADVSITGPDPLNFGDNIFTVTVTSEDKTNYATYTVTVVLNEDEGSCGNLMWKLSGDGVLKISGNGQMEDYTDPEKVPWHWYGPFIKSIVFEEGVESIGSNAFGLCTRLTSVTNLRSAPQDISGKNVFGGLPLASLTLYVPSGSVANYTSADIWKEFRIAVSVTSVSIDETSVNMFSGERLKLTATVLPEDATNQTLVWSSSNETVATVNEEGSVTAVDAGSAIIKAETEDGEFADSCTVNVTRVVSGIPQSGVPAVQVYFNKQILHVNSPVAERVDIYSVTGNLLYRQEKPAGKASFTVNRSERIVIVKGASGWVKLLAITGHF
jgi:hypothetical protein